MSAVLAPQHAPHHPVLSRVAAATLLAGSGLLALAGPASAHVTVGADNPARGSADTVLTFRVPNEEDGASTVKVDIKFPVKTPLASVKPAPVAGWTVTTKSVTFNPPITTDDGTIKDGVGEVTYTAKSAADGIPPGGFGAFQVLVGPLPDAASLAFPTVQTYSSGKVASWVEPIVDPAKEPENPAPTLELTAAAAEPGSTETPAPSTSASTRVSASPSVSAAPVAAPVDLSSYASKSDVSTGRTLGLIGLVLGAVGLLAGGLALARSRRTS